MAENKEMQVPEQAGLILVPPVLRMPGECIRLLVISWVMSNDRALRARADSHRISPHIQQFFFLWVPEPTLFPYDRNPTKYIEYPSLSSEFHQLLGSLVSDQLSLAKTTKQVRGASLHWGTLVPRGVCFFWQEPAFCVRGSSCCLPGSFTAGGSARCLPGSFPAGGSISNFLYESSSFSALRAVSQAAVGLNLT